MLAEEIEELGKGEKQFEIIYFPGKIPQRTKLSL